MDQDAKYETRYSQLLREDIGETLQYLGLCTDFLENTLKAPEIKAKKNGIISS